MSSSYEGYKVIEKLAAYAHEAWSGWMRYLFTKGVRGEGGEHVLPPESVARWERQMATPYAGLPEGERASDVAQALKIMRVVDAALVSGGVALIAKERQRQVSEEGYSSAHDDQHVDESLASAAACYAMPPRARPVYVEHSAWWPWAWGCWKPTPGDRVRELVRAGALIAAEIDRLQRAQARAKEAK